MIVTTPIMDRCFHSIYIRDDREECEPCDPVIKGDGPSGRGISVVVPYKDVHRMVGAYIQWQCMGRDGKEYVCWPSVNKHFDIEMRSDGTLTYPFVVCVSDEPIEGAVEGINHSHSNSYEPLLELMADGFGFEDLESMNGERFWWWVEIVNEDECENEIPFE